MTLLVAGHETTATALAWTLERLTRTPTSSPSSGPSTPRAATSTSTRRSRRRSGCARSSPRSRGACRRRCESGRWDLPAGVTIAPSIYLLHRRADIYADPLAYRPERFIERPARDLRVDPLRRRRAALPGASFATFEMKAVLRAALDSVRFREAAGRSEGVTRRAITFAPTRGGRITADPA